MHLFRYDVPFKKDPAPGADVKERSLNAFLAALLRNGQILDTGTSAVSTASGTSVYLAAPGEDSLSPRHFNDDCREAHEKLLPLLAEPLQNVSLGVDEEAPESCACSSPPHYILITNYLSTSPPVRCGGCYGPAPLYRLPRPFKDPDYQALLRWMRLYRACDEFQMDSGFGEEFGLHAMTTLDSPLNAMGRELCGDLAEKTGKRFYSYLHRYDAPRSEACLGCGGAWALSEPHHIFNFRCDGCGLVSAQNA